MNLIKNSIEALSNQKNGQIEIKASLESDSSIVIKVTDNGKGISEDIIDQIFIPFFSTKKEGSGIGLSLSRQIMIAHKGNIFVKTKVGEGSTFILEF